MNNYHYIIAGLPDLLPDFTQSGHFSYSVISEAVREQLSPADRRAVDWLEAGADSSILCGHFYRAAARQRSRFIRSWYGLDRMIRNSQVRFLASKEGFDPGKYIVGETDSRDEEAWPVLQQIFRTEDLLEREHALDRYRWDRITELTTFHYFDMDVILGFLAKAMIVGRWSSLDRDKGAELFRRYVDEVRGTFKGVDFN